MAERTFPCASLLIVAAMICLSGAADVAQAQSAPSGSDGIWSAIAPPSGRHSHTLLYDQLRDRLVLFGGDEGIRRRDVWMVPLSGDPAWTRVMPSGTQPVGRFSHTSIHDPLRDRMIVFGGEVDQGVDYVNEIWSLSFADPIAWSAISTPGEKPVGRMEHSAVYDPLRDRMIVFGGRNRTIRFGDVWALSLSGAPVWERIDAAGPVPSPRSGHVAAYDAALDRMIIFGGSDGDTLNEVWELTFAPEPAWRPLSASGDAPACYRAAGTLEPDERRLILYGGMGLGARISDELWALNLDSMEWSRLEASGSRPSPRYRHDGAYDSARQRWIFFGGSDPNRENDLWALELSGSPEWSKLIDLGTPPPWRFGHAMVYEPVGDRMLIFGGATGGSGSWRNDIRALNLAGNQRWYGVDAAGAVPATTGHSLIHDPLRHRLVSFGGFGSALPNYNTNETWVLALTEEPLTWIRLDVHGSPPRARDHHSAIYDPVRDRMIVFGGGSWPSPVFLNNDVWSLSFTDPPTWTELHPAGPIPTGRGHHKAIYDPMRDRMIVHDGGGTRETWILSLGEAPTWTQLAPVGEPPPPYPYGAVYDPIRDRIVVHDDLDVSTSPNTNAWELSLSEPPTWRRLEPAGPLLGGGLDHQRRAIYDPRRDRLIAFSGWPDGGGDTWALTWGEPTRPGVMAEVAEWPGGSEASAAFSVFNPLPGARAVEWTLACDRAWPGLPLRGSIAIDAFSAESLVVLVPVPDTARAEHAVLRISAAYGGATGNETIVEKEIVESTTATLASLVLAEAGTDYTRLEWYVSARMPITVLRREPTTAWVARSEVTPENGMVRFEDRDVSAGLRYGYRLEWTEPSGRVSAGETWLDVPQSLGLALHGARPNPTRDDLRIAFTLPRAGAATLELFDIGGRRLATATPARLAAGFHMIPLARPTALAPGVYIVRLEFAGSRLQRRVVLVDAF